MCCLHPANLRRILRQETVRRHFLCLPKRLRPPQMDPRVFQLPSHRRTCSSLAEEARRRVRADFEIHTDSTQYFRPAAGYFLTRPGEGPAVPERLQEKDKASRSVRRVSLEVEARRGLE